MKVFQDSAQSTAHDDFQQWRMDNPNGLVLNICEEAHMMHTTGCSHFGDKEWRIVDFGKSLTRNKKMCFTTIAEFREYADAPSIPITWCGHCSRKARAQLESK